MFIQHKNIVAPHQVPADAIRLRVLHVGDGDGFRTKILHRPGLELEASVRFAFVDAPELKQRGGPEARDFLKALIGGKTLDVAITDKTETGTFVDRYGRIVGVPYLTEVSTTAPLAAKNNIRKIFGTRHTIVRNIELEMVLNGWAWVLERYGPEGGYHVAQEEARRKGRGIWAFDSNLSPWAFKKQVHQGRLPADRFLASYDGQKADLSATCCPRHGCGGQMKLRKGKHGSFLGCSNFPKCKVTRNQ